MEKETGERWLDQCLPDERWALVVLLIELWLMDFLHPWQPEMGLATYRPCRPIPHPFPIDGD